MLESNIKFEMDKIMEIIENIIKTKIDYNIYCNINLKDSVFFDIETTGFTPKNTLLYLIGCIYYDSGKNKFVSKQWFMNEVTDEPLMISDFFNCISKYKYLINYNGDGFDIPYIEKKCSLHNICYSFDNFISIDIYKKIQPYKHIFDLENIKQKSIEKFLNINRDDKYNGKELIPVFYEYLKHKTPDYKDFLILHNFDDINGLIDILPILNYTSIFQKKLNLSSVTILNDKNDTPINIVIKCITDYPVKTPISFGNSLYNIEWQKQTLTINIRVYSGGLKFFYPNYKDYYYLPDEDCSIHKSVAFYVDKNFRTKANAANCYSKKTGRFLPQIHEVIKPYFKINYDDKITYFELTKEVLDNPALILSYIDDILNNYNHYN